VRSYAEAVDAGLTSPSREVHAAVGSPRRTAKSPKMAFDMTCGATYYCGRRLRRRVDGGQMGNPGQSSSAVR